MVDDFKLSAPKTKEFLAALTALGLKGTALVVVNAVDKNLVLASRNVQQVEVATGDSLNTYQILRSDKLVFTRSALEMVEARLNKE